MSINKPFLLWVTSSFMYFQSVLIIGIPKFLPSFPGLLLENEVKNLKKIIAYDGSNNSVAVVGGSKISTKIHIIEFLLKNFNHLLIGGAMANTFLSAQGKQIGSSFYERSMVKIAKELLDISKEKIFLPDDVVVQKNNSENSCIKSLKEDLISKNENIFDIGPKTRIKFSEKILSSNKVLWNGPLGMFEKKPFDLGTKFVVQKMINNQKKNFFSVAGGGDTISMLKQFNAFNGFSYVSTGGGAFLEFIQGKDLPGLVFLNK